MEQLGIKNKKIIDMLLEKDSELREGKTVIDEFNVGFELFQPDKWNVIEKEIDDCNENKLNQEIEIYYFKDFELYDEINERKRKLTQNKKIYYVKEFEMEEEINAINKKRKLTENYCINNGIKL